MKSHANFRLLLGGMFGKQGRSMLRPYGDESSAAGNPVRACASIIQLRGNVR
jgi:hypothetical protein